MFRSGLSNRGRVALDREIQQYFLRARSNSHRLSDEISTRMREISDAIRVRFQDEQAQAESGHISPTQSYWNLRSGRCMLRKVDMSKLDEETDNLETRQLKEPQEFLGIAAIDVEPTEDLVLGRLQTVSPTSSKLYGSRPTALKQMCMKLVQDVRCPNPGSYIAVSYR